MRIHTSRPYLSELVQKLRLYPSRNRILHQVKDVRKVGRTLHIFLDCGTKVIVKDSRRGRAARWLEKMIYWRTCKRCKFTETEKEILERYPPKERLCNLEPNKN